MKFILPIFIIGSFIQFSCSEKIELDIPDTEPQIVVFSIIKPDSLINVRLSKTLPMFGDESDTIVNYAEAELWADGNFIENLQFTGDGNYQSSIPAETGANYEIYIDVPGFDRIHASTVVPETINVSEGIINPDVYYNHQMADYDSEVDISFYDPPTTVDYFQVSFYSYRYSGIEWDEETNTFIVTDSTRYYNELFYMHSNDPILLNEGDLQYYNDIGSIKSLVFSDQILNSQTNVKFLVNLFFGGFTKPVVIFRHINRDYYNFHKSMVKQAFNTNLGRFNAINMFLVDNPNDLYTNIENGIGIFAAYAETHYELEVVTE